MIKKGIHITFALSLLAKLLLAQGFTDVTSLYNINVFPSGVIVQGSGCSFYDFNKDGLDDLTYAVRNDSVVCYRNTGNGFVRMEIVPNTTDIKSVIWVDFDNDGDSDLMTCKRGNSSRFFRNEGNFVMTNITDSLRIPSISGTNIYGCAWGDYDRDGFLDAYFCTLNTPQTSGLGGPILNYLCHNNGNGGFDEVAIMAGVSDGSRENFQPVWIDLNMDGWLDLYLISELDGGNAMYLNNGDGTFTDVSDLNGSGIEIQSMSNSWSDYDHDGDWDLYTTNDITGNVLLQNNNGQFTDVASDAGLTVGSFCWGALWIDYNNDTWEDLHITTATNLLNRDFFYLNNGNGTFTEANFSEFAFDETFTYSTSKGDFNNDGFYDFTVTKTGSNFQLFQGIPNENNWVKFGFQGTHSNRDAVGTYFEVWAEGKKYIRVTHCGEAYLSQDSQYEIVGLASATQVDSLIIHWPRGLVEKVYNLPVNQYYSYIEGQNTSVIISSSLPVICGDQSATLDAGEYLTYLWDNGSTDRYRSVSTGGNYTITVTDQNGYTLTGEISISSFEHPVVSVNFQSPLCANQLNGTIALSLIDGSINSVIWGDESTDVSRVDLGAGVYTYSLIDSNGCTANGEVELIDPLPLFGELSVQGVLCNGEASGIASLIVNGGTGNTIIDWGVNNPNALPAGSYTVTFTDENLCSVTLPFEITEPNALSIEISAYNAFEGPNGSSSVVVSGGTEPYIYLWSNGDEDDLAENLAQGSYSCVVTDSNGCVIEASTSIIDLNVSSLQSLPISLYPNPTSSVLTIDANGAQYEFIIITDVLGKKIAEKQSYTPSKWIVDVSGWTSGTYFVNVHTSNGIHSVPLLIEH